MFEDNEEIKNTESEYWSIVSQMNDLQMIIDSMQKDLESCIERSVSGLNTHLTISIDTAKKINELNKNIITANKNMFTFHRKLSELEEKRTQLIINVLGMKYKLTSPIIRRITNV